MSLQMLQSRVALARPTLVRPAVGMMTKRFAGTAPEPLTWERFLKLRTRRRQINFVSSIFTGVATSCVAWGFISEMDLDLEQQDILFGLDAFTAAGLGVVAAGFLGSLLGPTIGQFIFKATNSKQWPAFLMKETDFLSHIQKNRVNPRYQSVSNPVPDYYGEKIGSLKDYRRWLRDCAKYNRARKV
ncbi:Presequence translocated-associated motor subunit PAM17 [Yarrowia sp. B02]|nr:Presequence translocated-associated motor subunit PAM17 [Yarrowia sp. B02]